MAKTEKLIEIIRSYPILYDLSHEDYKNIRKKDKIWIKIAKEVDDNADEIKKKWKNLRDTYRKYTKFSKTKSGRAEKNPKKWIWADQMEAYHPFLTSSNVGDIASVNSDSESFISEINMESSKNIKNENIQSEHLDDNDTGDTTGPPEMYPQVIIDIPLPTAEDAFNSTTKARTKQQIDKKTNSLTPTSEGELNKYFENKEKIEYDAIDCLLLAHAKTIKTFSGKRQAITKMKIAQVIMEQELLHLEELSST